MDRFQQARGLPVVLIDDDMELTRRDRTLLRGTGPLTQLFLRQARTLPGPARAVGLHRGRRVTSENNHQGGKPKTGARRQWYNSPFTAGRLGEI
jgi:hypothetical protein